MRSMGNVHGSGVRPNIFVARSNDGHYGQYSAWSPFNNFTISQNGVLEMLEPLSSFNCLLQSLEKRISQWPNFPKTP